MVAIRQMRQFNGSGRRAAFFGALRYNPSRAAPFPGVKL